MRPERRKHPEQARHGCPPRAPPHQPETGIGNKGCSGVRHQRDAFARRQRSNQLFTGLCGIVLVIADRTARYAIAVEQDAGDAGILASQNIDGSQRFDAAQRHIAEIADRGRDDIKRRLQRPGTHHRAAYHIFPPLTARFIRHHASFSV